MLNNIRTCYYLDSCKRKIKRGRVAQNSEILNYGFDIVGKIILGGMKIRRRKEKYISGKPAPATIKTARDYDCPKTLFHLSIRSKV